MSSNIILFPKAKRDTPPQSMEELIDSVEQVRKEHIEYVIGDLCSMIFSILDGEGFDLTEQEDTVKDAGLIVESIRSALYKTVGLEHSLHKVAQTLFIEVPEDDPKEDVQQCE